MHKAFVFFLAVLALTAIVYAMPKKEGFTNLMGVNWTSMNEGTPAALYTKLPIQQPKMVSVAEAGVGNIQPSPPPASDLPTAPANLRSKENPNPYRDPTLEPARYIRILGVKEDLQAFFGFQAQALDTRSDPAIQIPLNRARADMKELIDVQSVMERNPGIQSRITQKNLDDIQANLRYLREMLNDLEASGAIQPTALEGFADVGSMTNPIFDKIDELIATVKQLKLKFNLLRPVPTTGTVLAKSPFLELYADDKDASIITALDNTQKYFESLKPQYTTEFLKENYSGIAQQINNLGIAFINDILSNTNYGEITSTIPKVKNLELTPPASSPMPTTGTLPAPTAQPTTELPGSEPRASLRQLQEFQVKVVVEIQRLNASGTNDPVIQGRLNVLYRIKNEVDDVIEKIQTGFYTADTVPIFESDIEKALPVLGNTSAPIPQILQKTGLPPALASLLPEGGSPRDTEMAAQINNVVKGYMKNIFEGVSWGLNLNVKYDNPAITSLQAKTAEANAKLAGIPSTGVPGVRGTGTYQGADLNEVLYQSDTSSAVQTKASYEYGLPGSSIDRVYPLPTAGGLDWKTKSQQIAEQIRRRGMNPVQFGALPENAQVSNDFSWRGYARMMCTRLNASMDPGLAITVGCPPENWSGWKD
jgi:hypothetical protein